MIGDPAGQGPHLPVKNRMQRDITKVIQQITQQVPEEKKSLRYDLDNLIKSASYTAPEVMKIRWMDLAEILGKHLSIRPSYEWEFKIHKILKGEDDEV